MKIHSKDPRGIKTREKLRLAFQELLDEKPFHKITVADITLNANVARHTYYNHYETRNDIFYSMIDELMQDFFTGMGKWTYEISDPDTELKMISNFFKVWKENPDLVLLMNREGMSEKILGRLEQFFTDFFYTKINLEIPNVDLELAKYMIGFNTHSMFGLLKPWLKDGMKHPPEVMAGFMITLCDSAARKKAVETYKEVIRSNV